MDKMDIYNVLPIFAQNIACSVEGYRIRKARYGKRFIKLLSEYNERSTWTYEQLVNYRDIEMQKMIRHCYETVPYYTKLFKKLDIIPSDIKNIDDLKILPIITKQDVKDNFNDFISTAIPSSQLIEMETSGSTGTPFKFYITRDALNHQWAVWWRYRQKHNIKFDEWHITMGAGSGRAFIPSQQRKPPYFRINFSNRQILFSTYHMNDTCMPDYIKKIKESQIRWIHGYPSCISVLANYVLENNISMKHHIDKITIGGENLLLHQSECIEEAFGIKPLQHYGQTEGVANISQTTEGWLCVDEDYSVVEFIDNFDDNKFEIIGSTLTNYGMPFLRYRTGDIATIPTGAPCDIASYVNNGRLVYDIDGRINDCIVLSNGTKVAALASLVLDSDNILETQIVQEEKGKIRFVIVKNNIYGTFDEECIRKQCINKMGENIEIEFRYVDHIPRGKNGKLRFVVSKISPN